MPMIDGSVRARARFDRSAIFSNMVDGPSNEHIRTTDIIDLGKGDWTIEATVFATRHGTNGYGAVMSGSCHSGNCNCGYARGAPKAPPVLQLLLSPKRARHSSWPRAMHRGRTGSSHLFTAPTCVCLHVLQFVMVFVCARARCWNA